MRTFLILAFWYWFYNQLFFLLAAMGFFIIHFLVAVIGFGGMDTLSANTLCINPLQALRALSLAQQAAAI